MQEPNYNKIIESELNMRPSQVEAVLTLVAEWATVPFIARYRKERTGDLDENQIRDIIELQKKEENLYKAKVTALNGIEEQGKLTPELQKLIEEAKTLKEVEDIYKPYKLKKKTKAMIAIEKWFQVVADIIKLNSIFEIPADLLEKYPQEEIIEWAIEIIAAEISYNSELRDKLREQIWDNWIIVSQIKSDKMLEKLNEKTKWEISKFEIYKNFAISLQKIKPYQVLAINRWENLEILTVKIEKDEEWYNIIKKYFSNTDLIPELEDAVKKWYTALFASLENEIRTFLKEEAEDESIRTFQQNLGNLLLTKPEYGQIILGIDPGYRTGCKIVVLDELGNPLEFSKIYLDKEAEWAEILKNLDKKYNPWIVAIGNGTGSNETVELVQKTLDKKISIVNESGASVYSASSVAQEEFPKLDVTDRWTVSIARRYIDPLSELVKIPVWSIWVGMYQHDIQPAKLEEKLGYTVEDVVNQVWVNVNNASIYVLNHISGFDKRSAKKVYNNRPYKSRKHLEKVVNEKVYEQAIGFLRIPDSEEKLDNTNIHPEQYKLAYYIIENDIQPSDFSKYETRLKELYPEANRQTVDFIRQSYAAIGQDPRVNSAHMEVSKKLTIDDIKEWDVLNWVIRNVVAFWAFVDVGLKNDWLVHVSQIADRFVKDPMDFVEVGQKVKVRVTAVDKEKWKVQLSMRDL